MNTTALIIMLTVQITVTVLAFYFFYKVLHTKPNSEKEEDNEIV